MKEKYLDVVRMVLDRQLLDSNYVECGKVADLELEGGPGELRLVAVLTGPGVAIDRLPRMLRALTGKLLGRRVTRLPWKEVRVITSQIKLGANAAELGLNGAERRAARWLAKLPLAK